LTIWQGGKGNGFQLPPTGRTNGPGQNEISGFNKQIPVSHRGSTSGETTAEQNP